MSVNIEQLVNSVEILGSDTISSCDDKLRTIIAENRAWLNTQLNSAMTQLLTQFRADTSLTYSASEVDTKLQTQENTTNTKITNDIQTAINNNCIGVNQTWQDVTSSRSAGVIYTNTTNKAIAISINISSTNSSLPNELFVGSETIQSTQPLGSGYYKYTFYSIVPKNKTYKLELITNVVLNFWKELR